MEMIILYYTIKSFIFIILIIFLMLINHDQRKEIKALEKRVCLYSELFPAFEYAIDGLLKMENKLVDENICYYENSEKTLDNILKRDEELDKEFP